MQPTVSVVIPTYNQSQYLGQAIASALNQTRPPLEIIVVDDGSTDDTPAVLAGYGDRIRSVRQANAGVAAARNAGLGLASGDLLALLDSDDIWLPQKLERQVEQFVAHPELGLVHCGVVNVDGNGHPLAEYLDGMAGWVAPEMLLFRRAVVLGGGSATVVSRAVIETVGDFDVNLPPSEDWDFYYRVASRFPIGFVPELLVHYRLHGANGHLNIARMERAMMQGFAKAFHHPAPKIARLRRHAYGNLRMNLAGSYFQAGQYKAFLRHLGLSLWSRPRNISHVLGYFRRWQQRRRAVESPAITSTRSTLR